MPRLVGRATEANRGTTVQAFADQQETQMCVGGLRPTLAVPDAALGKKVAAAAEQAPTMRAVIQFGPGPFPDVAHHIEAAERGSAGRKGIHRRGVQAARVATIRFETIAPGPGACFGPLGR